MSRAGVPKCGFCKRPILEAGSNRRRYHTPCEQFVIHHTADKADRKRLLNTRSRRLRKQNRNAAAANLPRERPVDAVPLTNPGVHDLCAREHRTVGELRECVRRAARAAADVRGWR